MSVEIPDEYLDYLTFYLDKYPIYLNNPYKLDNLYTNETDLEIAGLSFIKYLVTNIQRDYEMLTLGQGVLNTQRDNIIKIIYDYFKSINLNADLFFGLLFYIVHENSYFILQLALVDKIQDIAKELDVRGLNRGYSTVINHSLNNGEFEYAIVRRYYANFLRPNITVNYGDKDEVLPRKILNIIKSKNKGNRGKDCVYRYNNDNNINFGLRRRILDSFILKQIKEVFPDFSETLFLVCFEVPDENGNNILLSNNEKKELTEKYGLCDMTFQICEYYGDVIYNTIMTKFCSELKILNIQKINKYKLTSNKFMGDFILEQDNYCSDSNGLIPKLDVDGKKDKSCSDLLEAIFGAVYVQYGMYSFDGIKDVLVKIGFMDFLFKSFSEIKLAENIENSKYSRVVEIGEKYILSEDLGKTVNLYKLTLKLNENFPIEKVQYGEKLMSIYDRFKLREVYEEMDREIIRVIQRFDETQYVRLNEVDDEDLENLRNTIIEEYQEEREYIRAITAEYNKYILDRLYEIGQSGEINNFRRKILRKRLNQFELIKDNYIEEIDELIRQQLL